MHNLRRAVVDSCFMRVAVKLSPQAPLGHFFSVSLPTGCELVEFTTHASLHDLDVQGFAVAAEGLRDAGRWAARLNTTGKPWVLLAGDPSEPTLLTSPCLADAERSELGERAAAEQALLTLLNRAAREAALGQPDFADCCEAAWLAGNSPGAVQLRAQLADLTSSGPRDLLIVGDPRAGLREVGTLLAQRWFGATAPWFEVALPQAADCTSAALVHLSAGPSTAERRLLAAQLKADRPANAVRLWLCPGDPEMLFVDDAELAYGLGLERLELPTLEHRRCDLAEVAARALALDPQPGPRAFENPPTEAEWHQMADSEPLLPLLERARAMHWKAERLPNLATAHAVAGARERARDRTDQPEAALPRDLEGEGRLELGLEQGQKPSQSHGGSEPGLLLRVDDRRLETVERRLILRVLDECQGNKSQAAGVLGLHRQTLYNKLERFEALGEGQL